MSMTIPTERKGFLGGLKGFSNAVFTSQCFLLCKKWDHLLGTSPNTSLCHRTAGLKLVHVHSKGWFPWASKCKLWNALCQEAPLAELDTYHSWT